jgi:hypothetical protein
VKIDEFLALLYGFPYKGSEYKLIVGKGFDLPDQVIPRKQSLECPVQLRQSRRKMCPCPLRFHTPSVAWNWGVWGGE